MPHMKKNMPIEFSFQFNPSVAATTRMRFPTAPAFLDAETYNQKCKVEFVSMGISAVSSVNETTIYLVFNGIPSNQYRLLPIKDGANALVSREFINTPLTAVFFTHDDPSGASGKGQFNNGNIITNGGAYVVCNSVWGQEVNLELREIVGTGLGGDANNAKISPDVNISVVMRITPITEDCGC